MNFVKRAGLSLSGRRSRTAALLGVFVVICALLLGGFLLRGAAARQEADAQRAVGVDVTVGRKGLTADLADRLDVPGLVHRYTAELPVRAVPRGFTPLTSGDPERAAAGGGSAVRWRCTGFVTSVCCCRSRTARRGSRPGAASGPGTRARTSP